MRILKKVCLSTILLIIAAAAIKPLQAQETFTFEDVMKFEEIRSPVLSADGNWVAFGVWG